MTGPGSSRRSRSAWLRWGIPLAALVVIAAAVAVVVATRGSGTGAGIPAAAPSSGSAPAADPADGSGTIPSVSPTPITQAPAPSVAARQGTPAAARSVAGATAAFTAPASWADGASVRVTRAHQQVSTGHGPGALVGQPQTVFDLELANGGTTPLDLNAVVVQATYGPGKAQAAPLYDERSQDFSGTVDPGSSAGAVYSFAIPADQLRDVVLTLDIDGRHHPVAFSGAVPTS